MVEIMIAVINDALPFVGAYALGYGVYKGIRYILTKIKYKPLKNPIKGYIRKEVVEYLNELKK